MAKYSNNDNHRSHMVLTEAIIAPNKNFSESKRKGYMAPLKNRSTMSKNRRENEEALNQVFAWSSRAKLKLASSNAQKAKKERRNAAIDLVEAKM